MSTMSNEQQQQRYCIGCTYLLYTPSEEGYCYSSWTYSSGEPAEMACKKGHWIAVLGAQFTQEKFQKAMEMAKDCEDFNQREVPE